MNDIVQQFISQYDGSQIGMICCKSNDQNGDSSDWRDLNQSFREQVNRAVIRHSANVPLALIHDLFCAEALFCRYAWGSSAELPYLGKLLLEQADISYLESYLIGKYRSFDTECALQFTDLERPTLEHLLQQLREKNPFSANSEFNIHEVKTQIKQAIKFLNQQAER
ncbi:hypothetical protein [Celerinatantimonas sp. MCCC 1A17872]|uniref:hypothetical protein n=1 Tax=Celerinatantimonas sp. MCCC 1A17872 TaxID=3177514 RepID=UPI0038C647EB